MSIAFKPEGYSPKELHELCRYGGVRRGHARWKYWPPEVYSFGRHIRDYANYPAFLPLHVYTDHGVGMYYDGIPPHELNSGAYCQFYHSPENVKAFRKVSQRPCYTMLSPFVHYRRKNGIEPAPDAQGTLAFHSHSTPGFSVDTDLPAYIKRLRELPEKFQPIGIMLHMHDVEKGVHKIYQESGFPVYTAGNAADYRFAERFYEVLRHFRYTTSNSPGSHTYYSVEMGIPYFLYGDSPVWYNHGDPNFAAGAYDLEKMPEYQKLCALFRDRDHGITAEQKAFVEYHLGIHDCVSPEEMHRLLWAAYRAQGCPLLDLWFQIDPWRRLKELWRRCRG